MASAAIRAADKNTSSSCFPGCRRSLGCPAMEPPTTTPWLFAQTILKDSRLPAPSRCRRSVRLASLSPRSVADWPHPQVLASAPPETDVISWERLNALSTFTPIMDHAHWQQQQSKAILHTNETYGQVDLRRRLGFRRSGLAECCVPPGVQSPIELHARPNQDEG